MKKLFLTSVVLLMALMAQAQTKIAPKLENGFKAVYTEKSAITLPGGKVINITGEDEYVVSDVTADGAVITTTMTEIETDADPNDVAGQTLAITQKMLKGVSVKMSTDAEGKVKHIINIDEVKEKAAEMCKAMSAEIAKNFPGMENTMVEQLMGSVTEQSLINGFSKSGVLALNGKTIANGAQETFENEGMKMKCMYFVAGKNIISNATLDMSKDELKEFIIAAVEKVSPEQAKMVKENIDMVMSQMKFEMTMKSTYELGSNGWMKSIKTETSQDLMGQSTKQSSTSTLKE
jgi:hypothetical protein